MITEQIHHSNTNHSKLYNLHVVFVNNAGANGMNGATWLQELVTTLVLMEFLAQSAAPD